MVFFFSCLLVSLLLCLLLLCLTLHVQGCTCDVQDCMAMFNRVIYILSGLQFARENEHIHGIFRCCLCSKVCDDADDADHSRKFEAGHIVPRSVLQSLWDWKAKMDQYVDKATHEYIFMKVARCRGSVSPQQCKVSCWCNICEKRFQFLDESASDFWKKMYINWFGKRTIETYYRAEERRVDVTKAVLFSMMVRGMKLSLSWIREHNNLKKIFETMQSDDNIVTYQSTTKALDKNGFLYCHLSPDNPRYRVEFPFVCTLHIKSHEPIEVICAQVPPFFCILPERRTDAIVLQQYLQHIVKDVQCNLDRLFNHFIQTMIKKVKIKQTVIDNERDVYKKRKLQNDKRKLVSITEFCNALTDNGCVLFFPYLPSKKPIEVTVH